MFMAKKKNRIGINKVLKESLITKFNLITSLAFAFKKYCNQQQDQSSQWRIIDANIGKPVFFF